VRKKGQKKKKKAHYHMGNKVTGERSQDSVVGNNIGRGTEFVRRRGRGTARNAIVNGRGGDGVKEKPGQKKPSDLPGI